MTKGHLEQALRVWPEWTPVRSIIPVVVNDGGTDVAEVVIERGSETAGPCDVAMGVRVERILAFGENPTRAGVMFAKREIIGGDIAMSRRGKRFSPAVSWCMSLKPMLDFSVLKLTRGSGRRIVGRLPSRSGGRGRFIAASVTGTEAAHEGEENGFDEVPIFGATGEESRRG